VRIPDVMVRRVFEPLWDLYDRSPRLRELRELRRSQYLASDELRARANICLQRLAIHAATTCPIYRERFEGAGIDPNRVRSIEDLRSLPILTKDDIRSRAADVMSSTFDRRQLVQARTGGSTGVSLEVFCDEPCRQRRNAAALRADEWSGWRLGEPLGAVWGNPPVADSFKKKVRSHFKDRVVYLDTMKLTPAAVSRFVEDWHGLRAGLLFGHAHSLFLLAEEVMRQGLELRPTGVVATSMMLLAPERRVIEKAFRNPVTNRYGCEEVSLIACECEEHNGLHLNLDHNIVEFLRPDGTPCSPGENGRIVVTELINYGMPMIRYEVGDWGVPGDRECPCGRGLPLMETLTGRTADFLVALDGSRVAGISLIERTLTEIPGIRQMQLVQDSRDAVQVNLVRDDDYDQESEDRLALRLTEALGAEVDIIVKPVAEIAQDANGKYRFAICRV
jgi:phenylacetate-CoA ligase